MDLNRFEQTLLELIPKENTLYEAARYSLQGGKRLRPQLLFAVLDAFQIPMDMGLLPACALEMVHTYSLIHDDLPCMDNDDMRRGKASLHKAFQESDAVLTGNFLLTYSFEILTRAPNLSDEERCALIRTLSQRAGAEGMLGGQILDLEKNEGWKDTYLQKTSALFAASLEFGAIIARVPTKPFRELGEYFGLAFQLLDDLSDQDGVAKQFGPEMTKNMASSYLDKALEILDHLPNGASKLREIVEQLTVGTKT